MSYPASSVIQKLYRNTAKEVERFLRQSHQDKYFVFNLSE